MKEKIQEILKGIVDSLYGSFEIDTENLLFNIQENKDKAHGDLASNIALVLAKPLNKNPKEIANEIKEEFITNKEIVKVDIAGPGFINFYLSKESHNKILLEIFSDKERFGKQKPNKETILIEYVSSNPTGPLHVGHGRGAVFGSVLASLLKEAGYEVDEEYYINDFGRQMNILAVSLWIRYAQIFNKKITMIESGYQGDYLVSIAKKLADTKSDKLYTVVKNAKNLFRNDLEESEEFIDRIIDEIKDEIGEDFAYIKEFALKEILDLIEKDLFDFGVNHNKWFSESSLFDENSKTNQLDKSIAELDGKGHVYSKDDAIWFRSTEFGDDKDRVLKRGNGEYTYFATDFAYHLNKYDRAYNKIINIWGSDHHGYFPRIRASMEACDRNIEKLEVVFIQFANLVRGGKRVSMSTRSGEFITLRELIDEVSSEAARFFYINRKSDQHLEFDLDLAKEQSKDNPLYYIQYAHARICSVLRKADSKPLNFKNSKLELLDSDKEIEIQKMLKQYPDIISRAAEAREPHLLCYYLRDLASTFHSYYNSEKFLIDDEDLKNSRLFLLSGIKQVIYNGLSILGISAPQEM